MEGLEVRDACKLCTKFLVFFSPTIPAPDWPRTDHYRNAARASGANTKAVISWNLIVLTDIRGIGSQDDPPAGRWHDIMSPLIPISDALDSLPYS